MKEQEKRFIWMQLLGFEKNDPDRGATRYIRQIGFVPDGICALTFHSDIVNQYRGMEEEYVLPPDVCAYYGIPRNTERERQDWTNHDLRTLCHELKKAGSGLYMSVMGSYLNNMFHQEWLSDHQELRYRGRHGTGGLNCLKRFADGSYFEDYFAEKLARTLVDYGFEGVHITDGFCPIGNTRYDGDFSTDMVTQFIDHEGIPVPEGIRATFGREDDESVGLRGDWIWTEYRKRWLKFTDWRWGRFFRKICGSLHAVGKKVLVLGMYCTDPFESMYMMGFDIKTVIHAGVDYIMPNIVPTGMYMQHGRSFFQRYMNIIPLVRAQTPDGHYLSMLGVQDASEEWNILNHAPSKLERDMYSMFSFQYVDGEGSHRAMDGLMVCLGDGIASKDWKWLTDRLDIAFDMDAAAVEGPLVVWSDAGHENQLDAYIETRRWSLHRLLYAVANQGCLVGGAVRVENISHAHGELFVPNFDLLPKEERLSIRDYRGGRVVCVAGPDYDPARDGITPDYALEDRYAPYALKLMVLGGVDDSVRESAERLISEPDDSADIDLTHIVEQDRLLRDDIPFRKVSLSFQKALAAVVKWAGGELFQVNVPYRAFRLTNGKYRLYLFGIYSEQYSHAFVRCARAIASAKVVSKFPVLPVRFTAEKNESFSFTYQKGANHSFQVKLQPSGTTIVDVELEE